MSIFSDSKPTSNTLHIIASTELLICEDIPINTTHLICSISTKDSEPVYLVVGFQSKPLILQDVCPKTEPAFESGGKGKAERKIDQRRSGCTFAREARNAIRQPKS